MTLSQCHSGWTRLADNNGDNDDYAQDDYGEDVAVVVVVVVVVGFPWTTHGTEDNDVEGRKDDMRGPSWSESTTIAL